MVNFLLHNAPLDFLEVILLTFLFFIGVIFEKGFFDVGFNNYKVHIIFDMFNLDLINVLFNSVLCIVMYLKFLVLFF